MRNMNSGHTTERDLEEKKAPGLKPPDLSVMISVIMPLYYSRYLGYLSPMSLTSHPTGTPELVELCTYQNLSIKWNKLNAFNDSRMTRFIWTRGLWRWLEIRCLRWRWCPTGCPSSSGGSRWSGPNGRSGRSGERWTRGLPPRINAEHVLLWKICLDPKYKHVVIWHGWIGMQ